MQNLGGKQSVYGELENSQLADYVPVTPGIGYIAITSCQPKSKYWLYKVHGEKFHFTHFIFTYYLLYYQAIILCFFFDSVKNKILNFAHFLHATKNSQIQEWWGMESCLTF